MATVVGVGAGCVGVAVAIGRDGAVLDTVGEESGVSTVGDATGDAAASLPLLVRVEVAVAGAVAVVDAPLVTVAVESPSSSSPPPQAESASTSISEVKAYENHLDLDTICVLLTPHRAGSRGHDKVSM